MSILMSDLTSRFAMQSMQSMQHIAIVDVLDTVVATWWVICFYCCCIMSQSLLLQLDLVQPRILVLSAWACSELYLLIAVSTLQPAWSVHGKHQQEEVGCASPKRACRPWQQSGLFSLHWLLALVNPEQLLGPRSNTNPSACPCHSRKLA